MPGPIISPPPVVASGSTLLQFRQPLAEQLGFWQRMTVSGSANTDAARVLLVNDFRDDEEARARFAGFYAYVATGAIAGEQSRFLTNGYEGPLGGMVLARPYSAGVTAGAAIEVSWPFPVKKYLTVIGLNTLVNDALARLEVEARITFTGNGTRTYSLIGYPFIRSENDVIGIKDRSGGIAASDPTDWSPFDFEIKTNGVDVTLETGYAYPATDTFELIVPVPANQLTFDGISWTYNPNGLVNDTYQAAAKVEHVVAIGMVKGLQEWAKLVRVDPRMSPDDRRLALAQIEDRKRSWAATAARIIMTDLPERRTPPVRGLVGLRMPSTLSTWP